MLCGGHEYLAGPELWLLVLAWGPHVGHDERSPAQSSEQTDGWSWDKKIQKLLWRGKTMDLEEPERLLEVTHGQPWADVKALEWKYHKGSMKGDFKSIPKQCQYKYLAYTETYPYLGSWSICRTAKVWLLLSRWTGSNTITH